MPRPRSRARPLDPDELPAHVDRLYRAAWALCGSPTDAEDLVQETIARVLAKPRRLRDGDVLAYLMRVLRNTFLTELRTASRRPRRREEPIEEMELAEGGGSGNPEVALASAHVLDVIARLPEAQRAALVCVDVLGLTYGEAARALGIREGTVATRVFRARAQAARWLEAAGHAPAPPRVPAPREVPQALRSPR